MSDDSACAEAGVADEAAVCRVDRDALMRALAVLVRVAERVSVIPILTHVLLGADGGALRLRTCDMEIEAAIVVTAGATDFACAVDARGLLAAARQMARGMLVLRLDEGRLVVAHGERDDYCVHLPTLPAADFPSPLVVDLPWRFDLPASALRDLLGRTRHAISKDEHRYYLNSVCLEVEGDRLLAVATDGHRLARVCTEAVPGCEALPTGERALLVPREVVALLHDLAGRWDGERVWIEAGPERMAWGFGAVRIAARLIEGKFADWRRVIPEPAACSATLRRGPLLHALERVRMAGAVGVHLRCRAGEMEIEARCDGVRALATVPAEVVGEWPDRMVNRRYLADLVRQVRGGLTLVPAAGDAPDVIPRGQPGALRVHDSADPRALYLLMPMRA